MNRMFNRVLEKEIIDMQGKNDVMAGEVKAVRKTLGQLKKTEETAGEDPLLHPPSKTVNIKQAKMNLMRPKKSANVL